MIRDDDFDEPKYLISVVSKLVDLHPQTLRHYESIGLVNPRRSGGNVRLYSQRDVDRLHKINRLTEDLGVNLAGVQVILDMAERLERVQSENQTLQSILQSELESIREQVRAEVLELVRECGVQDDQRWQKVLAELERRF